MLTIKAFNVKIKQRGDFFEDKGICGNFMLALNGFDRTLHTDYKGGRG